MEKRVNVALGEWIRANENKFADWGGCEEHVAVRRTADALVNLSDEDVRAICGAIACDSEDLAVLRRAAKIMETREYLGASFAGLDEIGLAVLILEGRIRAKEGKA